MAGGSSSIGRVYDVGKVTLFLRLFLETELFRYMSSISTRV